MFNPVVADRVSQLIVDQIKLLIREGKLKPGDRLPSERELCARFGVSRVTVREALRVLESGGLAEIRVGAKGGAFLTTPTADQLGAGLAGLLTLAPVTAAQVTEARIIFELGIIPLAVERATVEDIKELYALVEEGRVALALDTYTMDFSATFHIRVAQCTHNPAIEMMVSSFHGPMLMSLNEAHLVAPSMGRKGASEHLALVKAIESRDVERAMSVMRRHLQRTGRRVGLNRK
jgi:DNA-binding FadR family transcriptional regulator